MSRKVTFITIAAACVLVGALGFVSVSGGASAGSAATKNVAIKDNFFSPRSVTVSRGGKVVWRWRGELEHNVRFRNVPSGASKRGSSTKTTGRFARTFKQRGTYSYVCTIHLSLGMKGSVHVE